MVGLYCVVFGGHVVYVGSSSNIEQRWKDHITSLRRGKHVNRAFQAHWDASGSEALFKFTVLRTWASISMERLLKAEGIAIKVLNPLFNVVKDPTMPPSIGGHTPATKMKIGLANKGGPGRTTGPHSEATKAKISAAKKGKPAVGGHHRPHTPEARAKMSAAKKGKPSLLRGRKLSEGTKAKISASQRRQHDGGTL